jgi:hypothetical protein
LDVVIELFKLAFVLLEEIVDFVMEFFGGELRELPSTMAIEDANDKGIDGCEL